MLGHDLRDPLNAIAIGANVLSGRGDGLEDQAGGVVWRAKDANNYYIARANALANNVTIYHTINGRRTEKKRTRTTVASNTWHTLRVEFQGTGSRRCSTVRRRSSGTRDVQGRRQGRCVDQGRQRHRVRRVRVRSTLNLRTISGPRKRESRPADFRDGAPPERDGSNPGRTAPSSHLPPSGFARAG